MQNTTAAQIHVPPSPWPSPRPHFVFFSAAAPAAGAAASSGGSSSTGSGSGSGSGSAGCTIDPPGIGRNHRCADSSSTSTSGRSRTRRRWEGAEYRGRGPRTALVMEASATGRMAARHWRAGLRHGAAGTWARGWGWDHAERLAHDDVEPVPDLRPNTC